MPVSRHVFADATQPSAGRRMGTASGNFAGGRAMGPSRSAPRRAWISGPEASALHPGTAQGTPFQTTKLTLRPTDTGPQGQNRKNDRLSPNCFDFSGVFADEAIRGWNPEIRPRWSARGGSGHRNGSRMRTKLGSGARTPGDRRPPGNAGIPPARALRAAPRGPEARAPGISCSRNPRPRQAPGPNPSLVRDSGSGLTMDDRPMIDRTGPEPRRSSGERESPVRSPNGTHRPAGSMMPVRGPVIDWPRGARWSARLPPGELARDGRFGHRSGGGKA